MNPTPPDTRPCARCGAPTPRYVNTVEVARWYCKPCRHTMSEFKVPAQCMDYDYTPLLRQFVERMFASEGAR